MSTSDASPLTRALRLSPLKVVALAALALLSVVALVVVSLAVSVNGLHKTMVAKESALSAQYSANQNELSSYVSSIKEALGVTDRSTAALDQVLSDAVKGRYEGETSAAPGTGALFSAITEAYPDLNAMTVNYANVQTAVFAGRESYKNQQNRLLDMIRDYDTWRDGGFYNSVVTGILGAPSEHLVASIGQDSVTGQAALTRMKQIVITSDTAQAYQSGQMDPLDLGPSALGVTTAP